MWTVQQVNTLSPARSSTLIISTCRDALTAIVPGVEILQVSVREARLLQVIILYVVVFLVVVLQAELLRTFLQQIKVLGDVLLQFVAPQLSGS